MFTVLKACLWLCFAPLCTVTGWGLFVRVDLFESFFMTDKTEQDIQVRTISGDMSMKKVRGISLLNDVVLWVCEKAERVPVLVLIWKCFPVVLRVKWGKVGGLMNAHHWNSSKKHSLFSLLFILILWFHMNSILFLSLLHDQSQIWWVSSTINDMRDTKVKKVTFNEPLLLLQNCWYHTKENHFTWTSNGRCVYTGNHTLTCLLETM